MSRSRKKNPFIGWAGHSRGQMRKWKTENNRVIRRLDGEIPNGNFYKRLISAWLAPNDGKQLFDEPKGYRK